MTTTPNTNVLIIGGGISGLSAAWFLHKHDANVTVLEAEATPGGTIATDATNGFMVELGPNTTLRRKQACEDALGRLVEQVGLMPDLLEAGRTGKKRFVVRNGKLVTLPGSPPAFLATKLFSASAKMRLFAEPFIGKAKDEETIAQFVTRRLGQEFLDYAVEPFISGVYAGDPKTLSVQAAVSKIYALERDYGSLIKAAIVKAWQTRSQPTGAPTGGIVSFRNGMAALPITVARALPDGCVQTGQKVTAITRDQDKWRVESQSIGGSQTYHADHVVIAVPAKPAARLLRPLSAVCADALDAIDYAPIVSVAFGFQRSDVAHPMDGFGFLVPRREGIRTLGALFSSSLFEGRAIEDHVLISAFIGGAMDTGILDLDDDAVQAQVLNDITPLLGLSGEPMYIKTTRYASAIPQYTLGHLNRIDKAEQALASFPNIHFRANWTGGISVADCVKNGELLAERIINP